MWRDPLDVLPAEREFVLVMLRHHLAGRDGVSGPYVAWLRYLDSTGDWFFVVPARASRSSLCGVPLVWRPFEYDNNAARGAANASLGGRPVPLDADQPAPTPASPAITPEPQE